VLALEGIGRGFDQDFRGLDEAGKKFDAFVLAAEREGFRKISFMDIIDFEEKAS
jgi:hypothetical protein